MLSQYLGNLKVDGSGVTVAKLNSRRPDYASYRITVSEDALDTVLSTESWPTGVKIGRFFRQRVDRSVGDPPGGANGQ